MSVFIAIDKRKSEDTPVESSFPLPKHTLAQCGSELERGVWEEELRFVRGLCRARLPKVDVRTSAFLPLDEDGRPPFPEKRKTPGEISPHIHFCGNLLRGPLYAIHRLLLSSSRLTRVPQRALLSVQGRDTTRQRVLLNQAHAHQLVRNSTTAP